VSAYSTKRTCKPRWREVTIKPFARGKATELKGRIQTR
jgi:hypothetical protein